MSSVELSPHADANRAGAVRRENRGRATFPTAHMWRQTWSRRLRRLLQVFRLAGASFESADDEQLNTWHERLNVLWRNIASPQVALWTHVIRRRERSRGAA